MRKLDEAINENENARASVLLLATSQSSYLWFDPEHSPRNVELCTTLQRRLSGRIRFIVCPTTQSARGICKELNKAKIFGNFLSGPVEVEEWEFDPNLSLNQACVKSLISDAPHQPAIVRTGRQSCSCDSRCLGGIVTRMLMVLVCALICYMPFHIYHIYQTLAEKRRSLDREKKVIFGQRKANDDKSERLRKENEMLRQANQALAKKNQTLAERQRILDRENKATAFQRKANDDKSEKLRKETDMLSKEKQALAKKNQTLAERQRTLDKKNNATSHRKKMRTSVRGSAKREKQKLRDTCFPSEETDMLSKEKQKLAQENQTLAQMRKSLDRDNKTIAPQQKGSERLRKETDMLSKEKIEKQKLAQENQALAERQRSLDRENTAIAIQRKANEDENEKLRKEKSQLKALRKEKEMQKRSAKQNHTIPPKGAVNESDQALGQDNTLDLETLPENKQMDAYYGLWSQWHVNRPFTCELCTDHPEIDTQIRTCVSFVFFFAIASCYCMASGCWILTSSNPL